MASRSNVCAGCLTVIKGRKYMKCSACEQTYDLLCANVSEKSFIRASTSEDWKCDACKSKQPRSDNTNTPVRGSRAGCRPEGATSGLDQELECDKNTQSNTHCSTFGQSATELALDEGLEVSQNESMIRAIENRIMAAVKQELPSLLASVMKVELEPIRNDIQSFNELQQTVLSLSGKQEEMQKSLKALAEQNNQLKAENSDLRCTVTDLSERLNNVEQHLRDNNLEIHGIPEHRTENIRSVLQQCARVVNHDLSSEDVVNCTRVAKLNKDSKLPRTIIVKFKSVGSRDEFYSAVHRYNKSHPKEKLNTSLLGYSGDRVPVYVSEHLSPLNKSLHAEARRRAKAASYKFVWVRNGRIYVRRDATSQYILIKNVNSLGLIK